MPSKLDLVRLQIYTLLSQRAEKASICPSEVARALYPDPEWRTKMNFIREVAAEMSTEGKVTIKQGGVAIDLKSVKGPVRIARGPGFEVLDQGESSI